MALGSYEVHEIFDWADAYDEAVGLDYIRLEPAEQRVALEAIQANRREQLYVAVGVTLLDHLNKAPDQEPKIESALISLARLEGRPIDEYLSSNLVKFTEFREFIMNQGLKPTVASRMTTYILLYRNYVPGLIIDRDDLPADTPDLWLARKMLNVRVLESFCNSNNLIKQMSYGGQTVAIAEAFIKHWHEKYD